MHVFIFQTDVKRDKESGCDPRGPGCSGEEHIHRLPPGAADRHDIIPQLLHHFIGELKRKLFKLYIYIFFFLFCLFYFIYLFIYLSIYLSIYLFIIF